MVTDVVVVTAVVVAVKVALVALGATFTLDGTVALALLLCNETDRPVAGAGPVNVTVPVEGLPPTTEEGLMLTADNAGGLIVSPACRLLDPYVAVIVTGVELLTATVVTWNVALLALAATFTLAGTLALVLLFCSETEMLLGVGPDRVTVPVDEFGPTTVVGFKVTEESVSGLMVSVAAGGVTVL